VISEFDIKKAVVDTLRKNFEYPIYEFGVVEGMKFPCLFARVWGKGEIETRNIYHQDYTVEIVMMYGNNEKGTEAAALKDMKKMRQAFLTHLKTEQRLLPVSDFDTDYTGERGNIPRFLFDLDFYDSLYEPETGKMMEDVKVNLEAKRAGLKQKDYNCHKIVEGMKYKDLEDMTHYEIKTQILKEEKEE
jgi:hypothetical protein